MGSEEGKCHGAGPEAGGKPDEEKFAEILAMGEEERNRYFSEIAYRYDQGMPVKDSVVRLDQEKAIAEDLENHKPVLIRGVWRTGKTSKVFSVGNHVFQNKNCLTESVDIYGSEESPENFKRSLCLSDAAEIIAGSRTDWEKRHEIEDEIKKSGRAPLEYLNDYLIVRGEKVFLALDEVVAFHKNPEKLKFLASLKDLINIRLGIVLHHIAESEKDFAEIFRDFKTHYVRPLTIEEVGLLVRRPLEGKPIDFTNEAIEKIFEITGGRPLEINNICRVLFDPYSKSKKWKAHYNAADIDEVVTAAKEDYRGVFDTVLRNYEKVYKLAFGDTERKIIDRLINEAEIPAEGDDFDGKAMQTLINLSFVREDKRVGAYVINGTLFAERIEELKKENK
jgi:hypothetical protein